MANWMSQRHPDKTMEKSSKHLTSSNMCPGSNQWKPHKQEKKKKRNKPRSWDLEVTVELSPWVLVRRVPCAPLDFEMEDFTFRTSDALGVGVMHKRNLHWYSVSVILSFFTSLSNFSNSRRSNEPRGKTNWSSSGVPGSSAWGGKSFGGSSCRAFRHKPRHCKTHEHLVSVVAPSLGHATCNYAGENVKNKGRTTIPLYHIQWSLCSIIPASRWILDRNILLVCVNALRSSYTKALVHRWPFLMAASLSLWKQFTRRG